MKKLLFVFLACCALTGCTKDDSQTAEEQGKQAADEFCDCYKTNSKDYCLGQLTSKYSQPTYVSDAFINAFNNESVCSITLQKITIPQ